MLDPEFQVSRRTIGCRVADFRLDRGRPLTTPSVLHHGGTPSVQTNLHPMALLVAFSQSQHLECRSPPDRLGFRAAAFHVIPFGTVT